MQRFQAKLLIGALGLVVLTALSSSFFTTEAGFLGLLKPLAIGAIIAGPLTYWLSRRILEPLRELEERLSDLANETLEPRLQGPIRDEQDHLIASSHRSIDLIHQRSEARRRDSRRLAAVFDAMGEGVLVLDNAGHILSANPAFRELLGAWGEIDGRPVREVIRNVEINRLLDDVRASSDPILRDIEIQRPTSHRVMLTHGIGIPTEGKREGLLIVFHDVTQLRRLDRVRRDFVANASHELRTPLTAIQGYAETLATGSLSPKDAAPQLEIILRNARRMSQLIEDLITLSRIEEEPEPNERSPIDVERVASQMLADLQPRFERAQLTAEVVSTSDSPLAWADRLSVEQILENLVTNAIRYTDAGGSVTILIENKAERLQITVSDTGIGIPEESQDRIFERFYRVDAARTRAVGSTGLGLSIARRLVEALGGQIGVDSQLGAGSHFWFNLPVPAVPAEGHASHGPE